MLKNSPIILLFIQLFFIAGISACNKVEQSNEENISVNLTWQQTPIDCLSGFSLMDSEKTWFIEQFQFYLSAIAVMNSSQQWQSLTLAPSEYQSNNVALIGEHCRSNTDTDVPNVNANWQIKILESDDFDAAALANMKKIRFSLGIPFALNHLNPITQNSPLNMPSMFWVWQTGHKFLRLELASNDDQWQFHLGSTGCTAPSALRAPKIPCRYPNLSTFELELPPSKETAHYQLNLDLSALLGGLKLSQENSCQSSRTDESCQQLFSQLGLNKGAADSSIFSMSHKKDSIDE